MNAAAKEEIGAPDGARREKVDLYGLPELTDKQAAILAFLREHMLSNGHAPTVRDVGNHFAMGVNAARGFLNILARKRRITIGSHQSRSIVVHSLLDSIPLKTVEQILAEK